MMTPVACSTVLKWLSHSGFVSDVDSLQKSNVDFFLKNFASMEKASFEDVSFWTGEHYDLEQVNAGMLFIPDEIFKDKSLCEKAQVFPRVRCAVPVKNPYHVMVEFLKQFAKDSVVAAKGCALSAKVHSSAVVEGFVDENCVVGPGCVVMAGAKILSGTVLEANVTVYPNVEIGRNCILQAGVVIGSRGFGFYEYEGERRMVPHLAGVRIGNNCSFGANTVVAAGFISPTSIGDNCHFDSFVQIAHNTTLGNNIYMASQSGIAGSAIVCDDVEFGGGAQSAGHLTIGKGARIAAKSGVTKNIPAGRTVAGFPAVDIEKWRRSVAVLRNMSEKKK